MTATHRSIFVDKYDGRGPDAYSQPPRKEKTRLASLFIELGCFWDGASRLKYPSANLGHVSAMTSRGALRVFELYYDVAVILHAGTSPWVHAMTKSRGRKPVATQ